MEASHSWNVMNGAAMGCTCLESLKVPVNSVVNNQLKPKYGCERGEVKQCSHTHLGSITMQVYGIRPAGEKTIDMRSAALI
jgi:hypothetical protein